MKVVFLSSYSTSLHNLRGDLIKAIVARGHDVVAFAPEDDSVAAAKLKEIGATYRNIPFSRTSLNPVEDLAGFRRLSHAIKLEQPDLVFAYNIKVVMYGSIAAHLAGVPKIFSLIAGVGYTFMDQTFKQKLLGSLVYLPYRKAIRSNQNVFFQNNDDIELYLQKGFLRSRDQAILVNGSGINLERFPSSPAPTKPASFVLIARIIGDKGIREYWEAARQIKSEHPETKFTLIGPLDTNPTAISEAEVMKWDKEGIVKYIGEVADVRPYLRDASVFVLPSYYREGTPRSSLEAMATGRPVITADSPGSREVISFDSPVQGKVKRGKNGFLVPPRDVRSLFEAMKTFVDNPNLIIEMGNESRRLAESKYDVHAVNAEMIKAMGL